MNRILQDTCKLNVQFSSGGSDIRSVSQPLKAVAVHFQRLINPTQRRIYVQPLHVHGANAAFCKQT